MSEREKLIDILVMSPMSDSVGPLMSPVERTATQILDSEWLATVKADVLSGWVGWFEVNDSHVGYKQTFTAYEVAELLRGPEPFGFIATNHETGVDDE
jgi:hypothetical protein